MKGDGDRTIYHSLAFWLGTAAIVTGVSFHLPDFVNAREMHYQLAGMPMSKLMYLGMGLILGCHQSETGSNPIPSTGLRA